MRQITLPELCLVVLIGVTGSGKSTFARTHFRPTQVLSSDAFRGMVADDENDQSSSAAAFDALHHVAGLRLRAGRLTVIDATNVQPYARAALVRIARDHDVLPVAIVFDVSVDECWRRTQERTDRDFGRTVVARQHRDLRRGIGGLLKEGFRAVHTLRGPEDIAAAQISYERLYNDRKDLTGPVDIIGDVHGCRSELEVLLTTLGYHLERDAAGRPVNAAHPAGRTAIFLGDLVDRGPDTPGVLRLVMGMVGAGHALCVMGNHEERLLRALAAQRPAFEGASQRAPASEERTEGGGRRHGRKVTLTHGLAESLAQLEAAGAEFTTAAARFLEGLVAHYVLDGGRLVVAHAGLKEAYHGRASGRVRSFALYGETTGETDEYGLPVRYPWAKEYRGQATVVYGHTPTPTPEWVNNTICIDTGAVFGGALTALRWPSRELVAVPAERVWYEPARPFPPSSTVEKSRGSNDLLRIGDVTGRRWIDTGYGRVAVAAENAAAALEVMGRFAIDPADLLWLPPTMAPCSTSRVEGYLEHPAEAFEDYRRAGVTRVVCEAKHMGSRLVALVRRDAGATWAGSGRVARAGALWTRTGRPFFSDPTLTATALTRMSAAVAAAGLYDELGADWVLLDTELLPWSAKALELVRDEYASVAAAARAALPAALSVLEAAGARGLAVDELRDRTVARRERAEAFAEAYRRYCWPTDGLAGLRVAPFAVLCSGDARGAGPAGSATAAHHAGRDRGWHLALADRLVAADREFFTETERRVVDLAHPEEVAEAIRWWLALTEAGGEGMVVKPYEGLTAPKLVQPGIKCRGREYLRIIYGPDYTEPTQLERLRQRGLHRKRALALREYALGLAALDRVAAGEPLWRVHEAVFAILACESEPVDPRL